MVDMKVQITEEIFPINSVVVSEKRSNIWQKQLNANAKNKPLIRNKRNLGRSFVVHHFVGIKGLSEQDIIISRSTAKTLAVKKHDTVVATVESLPSVKESYKLIKNRMEHETALEKEQIDTIVREIIAGKLSVIEQAAFVFDMQYRPWSNKETELLTRAFAENSDRLDLPDQAWDKHSLGGVPGNKVSLLIVPIIAAAGLLIPKTSSRAITSPSGTADTMEQFNCNISFSPEEMTEIITKAGGMIAWAGGLNLVPADSLLIENVEKPLGVDPDTLIQVSIMSKKLAMGIDGMILDIPMGKGTKIPNMNYGVEFANNIKTLAQNIGITLESAITFGDQIIGQSCGPALEAKEGLQALIEPNSVSASFRDKALELSGMLLEIAGKAQRGQGRDLARKILYDGKAYDKMVDIIETQGGDIVKPEDIRLGSYTYEYKSPQSGYIVDIDNSAINKIAKSAGAPSDPLAGIYMEKKRDHVRTGDTIMRIFSSSEHSLNAAITQLKRQNPITFGGMILRRV